MSCSAFATESARGGFGGYPDSPHPLDRGAMRRSAPRHRRHHAPEVARSPWRRVRQLRGPQVRTCARLLDLYLDERLRTDALRARLEELAGRREGLSQRPRSGRAQTAAHSAAETRQGARWCAQGNAGGSAASTTRAASASWRHLWMRSAFCRAAGLKSTAFFRLGRSTWNCANPRQRRSNMRPSATFLRCRESNGGGGLRESRSGACSWR